MFKIGKKQLTWSQIGGTIWIVFLFVGCPLIVAECQHWQEATKRKNEKENAQRVLDMEKHFAAGYGATWVDLFSDDANKPMLAVDLQRRLLGGAPVAFEIFSPDVRADGKRLTLVGTVLGLLPLQVELTTDETGLNVVRENRNGSVWIVARLDAVTPRHEDSSSDDAGDGVVYYATGRTIAIAPPRR